MADKKDKSICSECESEFYKESSEMLGLCPECAHLLYGYKNCEHEFENGRCLKCFWNGNSSKFLNEKHKLPNTIGVDLIGKEILELGEKSKAEFKFKFSDDERFKIDIKEGQILELKEGARKIGDFLIEKIVNKKLK